MTCARRDFSDLHAIGERTRWTLDEMLERFTRKYPNADTGHVVRALAYFGDAEEEPMPRGMTAALWTVIRSDIEERVLRLEL
ncbi:MAG: hypothetical protein EXR75_07340 [Myxococcales bacterium]|nr:hypothetical protein [Myxococcales bacterium]